MTFEEFFKRKRIDLVALKVAEPGLFSEFKIHFDQMGEKSFDHTKKYWFNKLRLLYHLAAELKPDKVHIENQLAEQTITESILEEKMPAPSVGFKPRFKAGVTSAEPKLEEVKSQKPKVENPADAVPKPAGFKPRFNAGMVSKPKTEEAESEEPKVESPADAAPKPASFTPRFKAGITKPATETPKLEEAESNKPKAESLTDAAPKPAGFMPRFKAGITKPATETPKLEQAESEKPKAESPAEVAPKPAGFTPRFKAGVTKPKPTETEDSEVNETPATEVQASAEETEQATPDAEATPPKPVGFKPRFNMKMVKPKPPEEE